MRKTLLLALLLLACGEPERNPPAPIGSGGDSMDVESSNCRAYLECIRLREDDEAWKLACEEATLAPVVICIAIECAYLVEECDRGIASSCIQLPELCGDYDEDGFSSSSSGSSSSDESSSTGTGSSSGENESSTSDGSSSTETGGESTTTEMSTT